MKNIHGVVTALVTPLTSERKLDREALERLIELQLEAGVDSIFILGSVGEGPLLPDDVYFDTARQAAAIIGRRCPLLSGASDNSVARCRARLETLAELGVDYGVLTLPFYGWPGREEDGLRFFSEIAAASPVPVVAYNLPKAVGSQMPVEMLEALFEIPNVICIKDTHADFEAMAAVAGSPKRPEDFSYLPGNSGFSQTLLPKGADGFVTTPANAFPKPFAELYRLHLAGEQALAEKLDREVIQKTVQLLTLLPFGAAAIKGILETKGLCKRHTTPPWPEAEDEDFSRLTAETEAVERAMAAFEAEHPRAATA